MDDFRSEDSSRDSKIIVNILYYYKEVFVELDTIDHEVQGARCEFKVVYIFKKIVQILGKK